MIIEMWKSFGKLAVIAGLIWRIDWRIAGCRAAKQLVARSRRVVIRRRWRQQQRREKIDGAMGSCLVSHQFSPFEMYWRHFVECGNFGLVSARLSLGRRYPLSCFFFQRSFSTIASIWKLFMSFYRFRWS